MSNKLRNIVRRLTIHFEHKNREANDMTDALANEGSQTKGKVDDIGEMICAQVLCLVTQFDFEFVNICQNTIAFVLL